MLSPNGFQNVVNTKAAPAVEGDFASVNPRASVLAVEGNLVAGAGGLAVGKFAFVNPQTQAVSNTYASGDQIGFLGRNQQGLITVFLADATMVVPEGFMVTLFDEGEFWARFGNGATAGSAVFADETTGAVADTSGNTSGTASAGFTGTGSVVLGSEVLTIAAATDGILSVGDTVTATGVPAGTTILNQLTGPAGGAGTYTMSAEATATEAGPEAVTSTSTVLNVTAITAGSYNVGDLISGSGVTAGTTIVALGTGTGGIGTYVLSVAQNFVPATVTVASGYVATGFKVRTNCNPGELAIISSWGV
jgi:hypothetical protein